MSKNHCSYAPSIPVGILVSAAKKTGKAERPTPRRKPEPGERQVPWMWIATGGSIGWVVIVLAIALLTLSQEQPREERLPKPLAVDGPLAQPIAQAPVPVPGVDNAPVAIEVQQPIAIVPRPNLVRPPQIINGADLPPPLDIAPEELIKPQAPIAPPEAPKIARREIDLNLFQNCEQIGTNVLFMRNPPDAFERAKAEKKMVFMVHLSGNLEDKDFT